MGAEVMFRAFILSPSIPLGNGGGMHDVAFPAFSVASPILGQGADNQKVMAGRISREPAITCKAWTEATEGRGERARDGAHGQRTPPRPATQLSTHRPPPHPSYPHPSLGAGSALGKIPHLKNFVRKTKPENGLSRYYAMERYLSVV